MGYTHTRQWGTSSLQMTLRTVFFYHDPPLPHLQVESYQLHGPTVASFQVI